MAHPGTAKPLPGSFKFEQQHNLPTARFFSIFIDSNLFGAFAVVLVIDGADPKYGTPALPAEKR